MARTCLLAACLIASFSICPLAAFQAELAPGPLTIVARATQAPAEQGVLRADSSLVMVPVHVTTAAGTSVTSLSKEHFQLFEDDVEQRIADFAKDDAPISIGLLFDASGSMLNKMQKASEAAAAFFKTANAEDEFFLIEFNGRAKLAVPFTSDADRVYGEIVRTKPFGKTSLVDAIYLAMQQMKKARHLRKAIVILSDGGDNWSRHTVREVKSALVESDVQVYAMGIFDPDYMTKHTSEERNGPRLLDELAAQTGGRHYPVNDLRELPAISARIGNELRNEYLLGYYSSNASRDGKYRHLNVKLAAPSEMPQLRSYCRPGYYAPTQ